MTAFIHARSPEQVDEILTLRQKCWELFLQGKTTRQIGEECGRSNCWASVTIRELTEAKNNETAQSVRGHLEKLLDSNNLIRREAWEAWYQSKENKVKTVEKSGSSDKGGYDESSTTTEGQAGDASFLRVLIKCDERESALRGIEKPTQVTFNLMQTSITIDQLIAQVEAEATKEAAVPVDVSFLGEPPEMPDDPEVLE